MCTLVPSPFLNFGTGNREAFQSKSLYVTENCDKLWLLCRPGDPSAKLTLVRTTFPLKIALNTLFSDWSSRGSLFWK